MELTCSNCGGKIESGDAQPDTFVECPHCPSSMAVPKTEARCVYCAEAIRADVLICPHCKEPQQEGAVAPQADPREIERLKRQGNVALIFSIMAFVVCQLCGIVGLIMGMRTNKKLRELGEKPVSTATAAVVMGWISCGMLFCFVPIILAIAIPGIIAAEQAATESRVSMELQEIWDAEMTFNAIDADENGVDDYWVRNVSGLYSTRTESNPQGLQLIEPRLAAADPSAKSQPVPFQGYYFKALRGFDDGDKEVAYAEARQDHFGFCAYPANYPDSGRDTFILNEAGDVYRKDLEGASIDVFPFDPESQGWNYDW